jgi:predicted AAA+ superfamily ATPase
MLQQTEIEQVVESQRVRFALADTGLRRAILPSLPDLKTHALVISGIRRCGKSTLLLQLLREREPDALALNFDDPRLSGFDLRDFQLLDRIIAAAGARSLFLDEVQVVSGWELYVRQKLDEGFRVVVSGSNASLLSRELGTKLTGRHVTKELFPFSYNEFLAFKSLAPGAESLGAYLDNGGFPEYVKTGDSDIMSALFHDIVARDISVRHKIRDTLSLKRLAVHLISNTGNLVTAGRLRQAVGVKTAGTILEYFSHLEDSYLLSFMPRFSHSTKVRMVNPRKIYVIDPAMVKTASLSLAGDRGRLLENLLYWELRRSGAELYYFNEDGCECDFVVIRGNKVDQVIQVCHELTLENSVREKRGLKAAMDFFKTRNGVIVTTNQRDAYFENDTEIKIIPAWDYLTGL